MITSMLLWDFTSIFNIEKKGSFPRLLRGSPLYRDYIVREKLLGVEINDRNRESVRRLNEIVDALNIAFFDQKTLTSQEFSIFYGRIKAIIQS